MFPIFPCKLLLVDSSLFDKSPILFKNTVLISDTRCTGLILYILYSSPGMNDFFKHPWWFLLENGIQKSKSALGVLIGTEVVLLLACLSARRWMYAYICISRSVYIYMCIIYVCVSMTSYIDTSHTRPTTAEFFLVFLLSIFVTRPTVRNLT